MEVRRRLEPLERAVPIRLHGRPQPTPGAPHRSETAGADDAAARIDAARRRLRASIEPPADDAGE